jgi:peptide/nickel transport system permease protein
VIRTSLAALARNQTARVGLSLVLLIMVTAVCAPALTAHDPLDQNAKNRLAPPDSSYVMGRDIFGRDVFARVVFAGRISLSVVLGAVILGGVLGSLIGLVAGSSGGWLDNGLMRVVDVMMAFPSLLLGLVILAVLGSGTDRMLLALALLIAPPFARILHATVLTLGQREFVLAARSVGVGYFGIMARHILPNALDKVIVVASLWTATAIRLEASLSFIGLGIAPPTPTWGNMIREGLPFLQSAPWLSLCPGLAIGLTVLAFNLLADGLRDALDPSSVAG